ncbi:hypothetical protein DL93DRAFT_2102113 [Clavulina sp. PMI_390]|nr:hypothetical protein DL93DRAFT_2102113 [Clavulina sp. PMI_390]
MGQWGRPTPAVLRSEAEAYIGPLMIGGFFNLLLVRFHHSVFPSPPAWSLKHGTALYSLDHYCYRARASIDTFQFLVSAVNASAVAYVVYNYAIQNFGDLSVACFVDPGYLLRHVIESDGAKFLCHRTNATIPRRIRALTGRAWAPFGIMVLSILEAGFGFGNVVASAVIKNFDSFNDFKWITVTWLSLGLVSSTIIAIILVNHVRNGKTHFGEEDGLWTKLITSVDSPLAAVSIQTGAITVAWALVNIILILTVSKNYHMIPTLPLSKVYANCMMSLLNSRGRWAPPPPKEEEAAWTPSAFRSPLSGTLTPKTSDPFMRDMKRPPLGFPSRLPPDRLINLFSPEVMAQPSFPSEKPKSIDWGSERRSGSRTTVLSDGLSFDSTAFADEEERDEDDRRTIDS